MEGLEVSLRMIEINGVKIHYKDNGKRFEPDKALEWFNKSFAMRQRLYKNELHDNHF